MLNYWRNIIWGYKLKGGGTGSSESIHVKMPHCWKSHGAAHISEAWADIELLHFVSLFNIFIIKVSELLGNISLKGAATLKSSETEMQVLIKSCNVPLT